MNKKKVKFIIILIVLILIVLSNLCISYARVEPNNYSVTPTGGEKLKDIGNTIIGVMQLVGSISSVIVLVVMGIKYMIGSVEEKAQYKETMFPYIIGAVLVFSVVNILAIIEGIMS